MAFTYDLNTDTGKVRMLIGDTDETDVQLSDEEIQAMLALNSNALYATCSQACKSLAAKAAQQFTQVSLGSLSVNDRDRVAALRQAAEDFRKLDEESPAFAIAEMNHSSFSELEIIRNYILRTEA